MRRLAGPALVQLALLVLAACGDAATVRTSPTQGAPVEPAASTGFRFVDTAADAGLTTVTWCGRAEKPHLLESGGTGLALLDYDGDGDLDLYLVNGWRLEGAQVVERGRDALYRNRGDGTFEDVTQQAGLGHDGWGCGVAVGDADGDGLPDLFVTNFGKDVLHLNQGNGTFGTATDELGIDGWSTSAVFFDADGDGDQDLFVGGYVDCTLDEVLHAELSLDWQDLKVMFGPFGLEGLANRYFVNDGGGAYRDATEEGGLTDVGEYFSFAAAALDLDQDRDLDLYVANDSNPNYLYINDGTGRFQETGLWSGAALDQSAAAQAGMGLATGDVDADGRTDLFVTNFAQDCSTLYRNAGRGMFKDVTRPRDVYDVTFLPLSWGTVLADLDLDGDLDLFVANGHIYPQADAALDRGFSFRQANLLLRNDGARFTDVTADSGPGLAVIQSSRGVAAGDLDGDGDIDLVVSNVDAPPTLLRNDTVARGARLMVDAPGAIRIVVEAGERRWVHDVVSGSSFVSASDPRAHFGLGPVEQVDRVTVQWPDGTDTIRERIAGGQVIRVAR